MKNEQAKIAESRDILESLPLAYYLGSNSIKVEFDESAKTSYYCPTENRIAVAWQNVKARFEENPNADESARRSFVRCFLYHEVSHAILTPSKLFDVAKTHDVKATDDEINIIEDERIETALRNYFADVDFKKNIKELCKLNKASSYEDYRSFLFNGMRLDWFPEEVAAKAASLKALFINLSTEPSVQGNADAIGWHIARLNWQLRELFEKLQEQAKENEKKSQQSKGEGQEAEQAKGEQSEGNGESEQTQTQRNAETKAPTAEQSEDAITSAMNSKAMKKLAYGQLNESELKANKRAKVKLSAIIAKNAGLGNATGSAMLGYSGKFSAKAYQKDFAESCKWFKKRTADGIDQAKKTAKKTLNIWLDNSGSFRQNDNIINGIIKALIEIESQRDDFKLNVIQLMHNGETHLPSSITVLKKGHRASQSGKSHLHLTADEIRQAYNETRNGQNTFDIILIDGKEKGIEGFKFLDCNKTVFISEQRNETTIRKIFHSLRDIVIENDDYAGKLLENVAKALNSLF